MANKKFIPGLEINRKFYKEVVGPLLRKKFPKLKHSAALTGNGSDVLGFDTKTSMDHNWGPRMVLFLDEKNFEKISSEVDRMFRENLPYTFMGYSTNYTDPQYPFYLDREPIYIDEGLVNHYIQIFTIRGFFRHFLSFDPYKEVTYKDWLTFPEQALIEATAGEIYHDDLGLKKIQDKFRYYPDDIWMYVYWAQWDKIASEEAFVGRAMELNNELGGRIIVASIISHIIKLTFLMEKQYEPYNKWAGYAFSKLKSGKKLEPILLKAMRSNSWGGIQAALGEAYKIIAKMHNNLKITEPMQTSLSDYNGRPYNVIHAGKVNKMIFEKLKPEFKRLKHHLGAVDQFTSHARIHHMGVIGDTFKEFIGESHPKLDKGSIHKLMPIEGKTKSKKPGKNKKSPSNKKR